MSRIFRHRYGRLLDDFQVGKVYQHPWEVTIDGGTLAFFQASFLDATPIFASAHLAREVGFRDRPLHPLLLLNLGLSFSVHDVSEQAIAHLAYINVRYPAPCYVGDTVRASSEVLGKKAASSGDRGVVHVRTTVTNQNGEPVCCFERKALVRAGGELFDRPAIADAVSEAVEPVEIARLPQPLRSLHAPPSGFQARLPGAFDDFKVGDVFLHQVGKTVGESEHMQLTTLVRNTHPLHFDEHYCKEGNSFTGTRVVYGGLVFAWIASLASRDVGGHVFWELGWDEGAHPNGVVAGDTLYAASKVLSTREINPYWGEVTFRLVGVKNTRPDAILDRSEGLFEAELSKEKDHKISAKVFEITRTALVARAH